MKFNKWTLGLAAIGAVSLASAVQAEEAKVASLGTALSSTTLSGSVDTSMEWNLGSGNAGAPAYAWGGPSKTDGFNLNVVRLVLAKDPDAADTWGAGYKVDLIFGPDASGFGLNTHSPGAGASDFGVKQAYVDLKSPVGNGIDWKIGVFDTIIGYEVFQSNENPNYTRSWGYTIEPTTHTGVLASYQFADWLSASAGIANTYGPGINARDFNVNGTQNESYKTYMASIGLTAPKDWGFIAGSTLYGGIINGFNAGSPAAGGGAADQTSLYVGASVNTPIKELKLGIAYDYAAVGNQNKTAAGTFATPSGYANAIGLYSTYQATEKLSLNARGEYASHSGTAAVGNPAKVIEFTGTVEYDLWKNVISRLEFRWDHAADGVPAFGPAVAPVAAIPAGPGGIPAAVPAVPGRAGLRNAEEIIASIVYKF